MLLPFELDPEIIHHIIYSQAGSLGKSIIELLQNCVDADAKVAVLTMSKEGFACSDDGKGFASREDVLRFFGRFGTPHRDGDASFGRFRLGRAQIMAHASTVWRSNSWMMTVDPRTLGYHYDLEDLAPAMPGCSITGCWYVPLTDSELMSALQEVRDLVRYTSIRVELNGKSITRDPQTEKWDHEDEFAWYRVREDGAVSIYNQGVLVRHDPGHVWGAGGLIVSKRAIALNVSRTEILRKTCPVWKAIAKQFGAMADGVSARLGDHRKTEARREKSARALLSGDQNIMGIAREEEVITILPGKRHVTLMDFLWKGCHLRGGRISIVENGFDVPKGEAIARGGIMTIVHPQTLQRFGCFNPEDFREVMERIFGNLREEFARQHAGGSWFEDISVPELVAFSTLRDAFVEQTKLVSERDVLDKETRRAWTALRWCLQQYAGACGGGRMYRNGRLAYDDHEHRFQIVLGESNSADAWTDGSSYIAINAEVVQRLRGEPLKTAAYIFSLVEHEVAHQGDSLDCGHDEAFYQRYHDISIRMSAERQRYLHIWVMKYTTSMEREGKKAAGRGWTERYLLDRAGSGREKRGLPRMIADVSMDPLMTEAVPDENMALIDKINIDLVNAGLCPPPPDWQEVIERARSAHLEGAEQQRQESKARAEEAEWEAAMDRSWQEEYAAVLEACKDRMAALLKVDRAEIGARAVEYIYRLCESDPEILHAWASKAWESNEEEEAAFADALAGDPEGEHIDVPPKDEDPRAQNDEDCRALVQDGETMWGLERNAAAAGFRFVEDYLKWRSAIDPVAGRL